MKKTLTKSLMQIALGQACVALTVAASLFTVSCDVPENSPRSESIEVYVDLEEMDEPVDQACVDVLGGLHQLYVKSNVEWTASWEDGETSPWATVVDDTTVDPKTGMRVITLDVKRRNNIPYYTRRTGTLVLAANNEGLNYNHYVQVHQGSTARVSSDFSWTTYGSTDPRLEDGVSATNWSTALKDRGWNSTKIDGQDIVHLYGKKGFIQLGDAEGHGADIYSPYTSNLRYDSLLMVSFRAVAHTDYKTGVKDGNKFTVEVVGGGVIADFAEQGATSIELEAKNFDPASEGFPGDMWDGSEFMIFVLGTEKNPLTVDTKIRIKSGSLTNPTAVPNRLYVDNFYIRRVTEGEQPYFEQNGGSGVDKIMVRPRRLLNNEPKQE